ncbi:MAG: hypothetical protein U1F77_14770 [Kiritimatiellia bacterium]
MKTSMWPNCAGFFPRLVRNAAFGTALLAAASAWAQSSVTLNATGYDGANGGAGCPGTATVRNNIASPLTYCYVVSNTGTTLLSNLVVSDLSGFTTNITSLAAGQILSFYRETIITGDVVNVINVTGNVPGGGQVSSNGEVVIDAARQCPVTCFIASDVANPGGPDRLYSFNITNGVSTLIGTIEPFPANPPNANCLEALTFALPEVGNISPILYSVDAGPTCGTGPGTLNEGYLGTIDWDSSNAIPDGRWTPMPFPIGTGTGVFGRVNLNNVDGLEFDATQDGILYAVQRTDNPGVADILFQIDATTGRVKYRRAGGRGRLHRHHPGHHRHWWVRLSDIDDIAIGTFDGVMYGIANAGRTFDGLVLIDLQGILVLAAGPDESAGSRTWRMSFDPVRGELYGSTGTAVARPPTRLFKINILPPITRPRWDGPPSSAPSRHGRLRGSDCFLVTPGCGEHPGRHRVLGSAREVGLFRRGRSRTRPSTWNDVDAAGDRSAHRLHLLVFGRDGHIPSPSSSTRNTSSASTRLRCLRPPADSPRCPPRP